MSHTQDLLAEAIAAWRLRWPEAHQGVIDAAVSAVVDGCESEAVAVLAGSETDNPFVIDETVERAISEMDLESILAVEVALLATKKFAREVIEGRMSERAFVRLVHARFGHEANAEILNLLAELDDEYDKLDEWGSARDLGQMRSTIRETAARLLRDAVP